MIYTIAVIGCGVIGQRLGKAFEEHDHLDLKYAVDTNKEVLDNYCNQFSCTGYSDYREVLAIEDIDIIYIGVPPKYHHPLTIAGLEAGKHIICEKPISTSAELGNKMVEKAAETEKTTAVNFVFRYSSAFHKLKDMVEQGDLGAIEDIEIKIRMPKWPRAWQDSKWLKHHDQGGPLREIGSHFIFAVQDLFGTIDVIDKTVEFTKPGKFEKSIMVNFETDVSSGKINLKTLTDEKEENTLFITGASKTIRFRDWVILEELDNKNESWKLVERNDVNSSLALCDEFVSELEDNNGELVSFKEATAVQSVIDKIFV